VPAIKSCCRSWAFLSDESCLAVSGEWDGKFFARGGGDGQEALGMKGSGCGSSSGIFRFAPIAYSASWEG